MWKYNSTSGWVWVFGTSVTNQSPSYPNYPGSRANSVFWSDDTGLWLFGGNTGSGWYSDLWCYNIVSNTWNWYGGYNVKNQYNCV